MEELWQGEHGTEHRGKVTWPSLRTYAGERRGQSLLFAGDGCTYVGYAVRLDLWPSESKQTIPEGATQDSMHTVEAATGNT